MFFTYGGRTTGYAHFHTKLLLEQAGFQVQFSAEFLGRHTFNLAGWRVLPHRPDEREGHFLSLNLAPGEYTLTVLDDELEGELAFTVDGPIAKPAQNPLRLELRAR